MPIGSFDVILKTKFPPHLGVLSQTALSLVGVTCTSTCQSTKRRITDTDLSKRGGRTAALEGHGPHRHYLVALMTKHKRFHCTQQVSCFLPLPTSTSHLIYFHLAAQQAPFPGIHFLKVNPDERRKVCDAMATNQTVGVP